MNTSNCLASHLGEFRLIEYLTNCYTRKLPLGWIGVGDDCAVIPNGISECGQKVWNLITVDTMVENRHFKREYSSGSDIGWKLVMSSVSDIAAMGGEPRMAVISLCAPSSCSAQWLKEVYAGINAASSEVGVFVVGGDTVQGEQVVLSLTVIGETRFKPLCRSGAVVENEVWVSGEIGLATCGLSILSGEADGRLCVDSGARAIDAHRRPYAQVKLGRALSESGKVSSLIDISDGLLQDLSHIAKASKVDVHIFLDALPIAEEVNQSGMSFAQALVGGDDYQLLWTASLFENSPAFSCKRIGAVKDMSGDRPQVLIHQSELSANNNAITVLDYLKQSGIAGNGGFSHFA